MRAALALIGAFCAVLVGASSAAAGDWLPHGADATWTYQWSDSKYNPTPTKEKVTVKSAKGSSFTLSWTTQGLDNPEDAAASTGTVSFQETHSGLVNTDWTSSAPPASFPILCPSVSQCGNSLASTYYNVIWGNRVPMLPEPLVKGMSWSSTAWSLGVWLLVGTHSLTATQTVVAGVTSSASTAVSVVVTSR